MGHYDTSAGYGRISLGHFPLEGLIMNGNLDPEARNAMRAFLQRCEVRLSTMHRIANAFLSGAGLLVLFPVFYGSSIGKIFGWMIDQHFEYRVLLLFFALLTTFAIPLWSLYLLVKDLTQFYFVGQQPGYASDRLFNPTFALSAIAFPQDEDKITTTKADILIDQYTMQFIDFVVPLSEKVAARTFDNVVPKAEGPFHPATRRLEALKAQNVIADRTSDRDVHFSDDHTIERISFNRFNTALALAGLYDRPLHQEVAKIEVSLVRHNLALRRIVIRYVKSLLTMVLLFLSSLTICTILDSKYIKTVHIGVVPGDQFLVAGALMLWGVVATILVKLPIRWIYKISDPRHSKDAHPVKQDPSLVMFENIFMLLCIVVFVISGLYIVLTVYDV